jgi:hypothetical protein
MKIRDIVGRGVYASSQLPPLQGMNMSRTGTQLARRVRRRGVNPGTDAWFRAWFSLPYLTDEQSFK